MPPSPQRLSGKFRPIDFGSIISLVPDDCPLVGGQAVAWWAERYDIHLSSKNLKTPITSRDIDFWGGRDDLNQMASRLNRRAIYPHSYEMTVWVGAIPMALRGFETLIEFIHTVPGLDTNNPDKACVEQEIKCEPGTIRRIPILTPVSLVLTKLHALRHFDQKDRQDEFHLRVCLESSKSFITELVENNQIRLALWNIKRLSHTQTLKSTRRLEIEHGFSISNAIPLESIRMLCQNASLTEESQNVLKRFYEQFTQTS